ncbi:unnamed protein product [Cladocopium goreaui]|uniref:Pentatricopeptide repeat-containing protein, mitochondrial n=1 Tax=Cladocopium goreaui TaxID=2562237 RepID=A0A9P1DB73_9DINO|nr:unnamed protein product [Cladocopium goreaui]
MPADEASSITSLPPACFNWWCRQHAEYTFECSRTGCSGPPIPPNVEVSPNKRIALCGPCACRGECPFCSARVQIEDLHSITVSVTGSDGSFSLLDVPAALENSVQPNHQTLEQFNQQFQQLANKVQTTMRKTPKDFDISRCDRPEIVKLVEEAQDLLNCLKNAGLRPDRDTYRWLISLFARAEHQDKVEQWAHRMELSGNYSTGGYNAAIFGNAVPGGVHRADMWFNCMQQNDCVPDAKSYNILIQACARSKDSTHANLYFERMQLAHFTPDVFTFSHLIRACADSLQKAEGFWKDMQQADIKPIDFTCKAMLKACANAGNIDKALHFFEEGIKAGCVPDVLTFTTMISVFKKEGNVAGAEEWFSKMEAAGVEPDVAAFTCVIRVCGTAGDELNAGKWLAKLKAAGCQPNQLTYHALIICALTQKDFAKADMWLKHMLDLGLTPLLKTFHKLLEACEPAGDLPQAEKFFNAMKKAAVPPDVNAFNSMLKTSAQFDSSQGRQMSGQPSEEQKKWFLKMSPSGVPPNAATYDILTRAQPNAATHDILTRSAFLAQL